MSELVYVYAVAAAPVPIALTGIDGVRVRWLTLDDLSAAISDVSPADFEEEPLNERVRDMTWLGPRAVAHEQVNHRLFAASDASLPLSFGTVFRDENRVRDLLRTQASGLRERLAAVRGCAEWVVAMHLVRAPDPDDIAAASTAIQSARAEIDASPPGRAHLLRRRLAALERDEARRLQDAAADEVLSQLRRVARDVYPEPLPTGTVERPLLRASLLVPRADEPAFLDELERVRQRWPEPTYGLQLSGPWPPYRFGGLGPRRG